MATCLALSQFAVFAFFAAAAAPVSSFTLSARFEIIDADGSGTLQVVELVQGLLKIRGEAG